MKRHDFLHSHEHLIPNPTEEHVLVDKRDWEIARAHFAALSKIGAPAEQTGNSRYVTLVQAWTLKAQSGSNSDVERFVYEQCARELHELNAGN